MFKARVLEIVRQRHMASPYSDFADPLAKFLGQLFRFVFVFAFSMCKLISNLVAWMNQTDPANSNKFCRYCCWYMDLVLIQISLLWGSEQWLPSSSSAAEYG